MDKKTYQEYANRIQSLLSSEDFYNTYKNNVDSGKSTVKLQRKKLVQDISLDWIDFIDDCLPALDNIVRNPRKFIVQEEDIVDISLARSITTESVKHLAQHTNLISKVSKDGMVTPNKILNVSKEESYEIYENRFIWTLLNKVNTFITMRFDKIKEVCALQNVIQLDVESRFKIASKKMSYKMECIAQMPLDDVMAMNTDESTKIERIAKMDRIVKGFLGSSFAKQMKNSAPVRPPITRTNVILKNPNFKKALTLWQFVETYEAKAGYAVTDDVTDIDVEDTQTTQLKNMVALSTLIFESMYEHDTEESIDDEFSFMEFGEGKKPIEDTDDGVPIDTEDAEIQEEQKVPDELADDHEVPEEFPVPEEGTGEELNGEDETTEETAEEEPVDVPEEHPEEEAQPDAEEEPLPAAEEEEIEEEKSNEELEKEVEEEEQDEEDLNNEEENEEEDEEEASEGDEEDEEEEFDRDLFDIRKIYRRPEDDKMRQEEIAKIRDAIDRCMTVYKNEKKRERIREARAEKERQRLLEIKRKGDEREAQKKAESQRLGSTSYFNILGASYDAGGASAAPINFSTEPAVEKKPAKPRKKKEVVEEMPEVAVYTPEQQAPTATTETVVAATKKRGRPRKADVDAKDPSERNLDKNPVREKEKRKVSGFGFGVDINSALGGTHFDISSDKPDEDNGNK